MGVTQAKKTAWGWFSKYIRLRDCIITRHSKIRGICCTCNNGIDFKYSQAGHYLTGRKNDVLIDEVGVNLQCIPCNFEGGGEQAKYYFFLEKRYGKPLAEYYYNYVKEVKPMKEFEWREVSDKYRVMYNELNKRADNESLEELANWLKADLDKQAKELLQ